MTVTRWPHATQRLIWPYSTVPVPPASGWVQSRSVRTRMCRGALTRSATLPSPSVPAPRRIAVAAVSLTVALAPAVARAQNGAGDEQYTDPFANGPQQPAKPKPKPKPTPVQPVPHQQG